MFWRDAVNALIIYLLQVEMPVIQEAELTPLKLHGHRLGECQCILQYLTLPIKVLGFSDFCAGEFGHHQGETSANK